MVKINYRQLFLAFFNSAIIYLLLLVLTRLIGKKLLSQMTFFDFVTGITIGTIAATFITTEVKGYYVLISPIFLTLLVLLTGYINIKSVPARKLIEGEPLVIIQNGKIYEENMKKIRYNLDDLMMQLRAQGIFNFSEVEFAIIEAHGQLSVIKKSQYQPVTPNDLKMETSYKGVSSEIIRDGKIVKQNLEQNQLSHEWLYNELSKNGVNRIGDVVLATLETDGTLYVDVEDDQMDYVQEVEDDDSVI